MKHASFFEKLTGVYLAYLAVGLLLFPGIGGYSYITAQKSLAFLFPSAAYVLICVIGRLELALVGGAALPGPIALWKQLCLSQKAVVGLWLATALSTLFSVDLPTALRGANHWEGFWCLSLYYGSFLLVSHWAKPKPWLFSLFAIAMGINCAIAVVQLFGHNPLTLYPEGTTYYSSGRAYVGRFLGTIGSITLQGAMLSLTIPALVTAMLKGIRLRRFLLLIPLALCLFVLRYIRIDAALVGVVGGILLTVPVLPKSKKIRTGLAIAVLVLILAAVIVIYVGGDRLPGSLQEVSAVLHGQWEESFGSHRGYIWRRTLELVPERLLFGGGPDTLGIRLDTNYQRYYKRLDVTIQLAYDMAHNEYLNILVNQGLIALLLHLTALLSAAICWIRRAHADPIIAVCGSAVLGYCIQAFFGLSTPYTTPYLWLALALLTCQSRHVPKEDFHECH